MWAALSNVDTTNPLRTEQFLFLSVYKGRWLRLARYFDSWFDDQSPTVLADSLNLLVENVFPIAYDISAHCRGNPLSLAGVIEREPRRRLTDSERSDLSIRGYIR
jgi:hypothetical protein